MKRVPLQRKTPLRRGPIRRTPKKGQRRPPTGFSEQTKAEVRRRSGNKCEICGERASAFHHRKLRRHGDHRAVNCLHVCTEHHNHIHANPELSYVRGWLVPGHKDPAEVPVV